MAYSKTTWVNGTTPALNETNLNKIEVGIENAALATHAHGSITTDGKIGSTANLPVATGAGGAVGTVTVAAMKTLLGVATFTLTGTSLAITTS